MEMIKEAGDYEVTIGSPYWEAMKEKNGDELRMALVLPLTTEDEQMIFHRLSFTRTIITGGGNKGRALYDVSAEECCKLGMSEPFEPRKIAELEGCHAQAVVEEEEYDGKRRVRVRFLNSRKATMETKDAEAMWAELSGAARPKFVSAQEAFDAAADDDDLPF